METITIPIEGISPVLMNNPASMSRGGGDALKTKDIPTPAAEAEAGAYRDENGNLFLPAPAFRSCLVGGAKGRRLGKTAATTVVKGAVFCATEIVVLRTPGEMSKRIDEYEIDTRRAVIQKNGILRSRPKVAKWAAEVTFEIDPDFISEQHVRELLDVGGRSVGVGDYRPEKSGPFGRFRVVG